MPPHLGMLYAEALQPCRQRLTANMIIPSRYAPFVFSVIQAAITTGVASAVATSRVGPLSTAWIADWLVAWAIAWATMLPVVVFAAPLIQRIVQAITGTHRAGCGG